MASLSRRTSARSRTDDEHDGEQDAQRRQDERQSPRVDSVTHHRVQKTGGGADAQLRQGDHGRAERRGDPALALPVGKSSAGLPVSMKLLGRFLDDPLLMRVAYA